MNYRTRIFQIVLSKWYTISKDTNVILIVMRSPKTQSQNLKYNLEQLGKTSNYCFLSDDTLLYYRNAIDMSLLTDKLNLKCYVLYETKELLTEIYITIINILIFVVSIVIVILIIIIIIITINVINIISLFKIFNIYELK